MDNVKLAQELEALYPLMAAYAALNNDESQKLQEYCDTVAVFDNRQPASSFYGKVFQLLDGKRLADVTRIDLSDEVVKKGLALSEVLLRTPGSEGVKKNAAALMSFEAGTIGQRDTMPPAWPVGYVLKKAYALHSRAFDLDADNLDYLFDKAKSRAALPMTSQDWLEVDAWVKAGRSRQPDSPKMLHLDGWMNLNLGRLKKEVLETTNAKEYWATDAYQTLEKDVLACYGRGKQALEDAIKSPKLNRKSDAALLAQIYLDLSQLMLELSNYCRYKSGYDYQTQCKEAAAAADMAWELIAAAKPALPNILKIKALEANGNANEDLEYLAKLPGNYALAEAAFTKALELDKDRALALAGRGRVRFNLATRILKKGDPKREELLKKAETDLEKAIECAGKSLDAIEPLRFLGTLYELRGDTKLAMVSYNQAFDIYLKKGDPSLKSAQDIFSADYARQVLRFAVDLDVGDLQPYSAKAKAYAEKIADIGQSAAFFEECIVKALEKNKKVDGDKARETERMKAEIARLLKEIDKPGPREWAAVAMLLERKLDLSRKNGKVAKDTPELATVLQGLEEAAKTPLTRSKCVRFFKQERFITGLIHSKRSNPMHRGLNS